MPVAKSYVALEQTCEPYKKNSRWYVRVRQASGAEKEVRWYSDAEYEKMYPDEANPETVKRIRSVKDVLGFSKGYITIFKGDTYPLLDWFQAEPKCRYHNFWGWYVVSEDELPQTIPAGITPVQLKWEDVAIVDEDCLKSETLVRQAVDATIYEPSASQPQGEVGERLDRTLTVKKVTQLENYFGTSTFYLFEDESGNEYCWTTSARQLDLGETYEVRGTVKAHQVYKGKKQTVLTRCKVN